MGKEGRCFGLARGFFWICAHPEVERETSGGRSWSLQRERAGGRATGCGGQGAVARSVRGAEGAAALACAEQRERQR